MSDNEDDCRDTLLSLQTTSREATGVGASTVVFGTSKRRSYGSVNEIRSVVEPQSHPHEDTQGIPVQAQNNDDNYAVFVSNRPLETIVSPRSSINSQYEEETVLLTNKEKVSATCTKLKPLCGCKVICTSFIFVFIVATFGSVFAVTMVLPKSKHKTNTVLPGDTVLIDQISPFWFNSVTISKTPPYKQDTHQVKLYTTPCRDLVTNEKDHLESSPVLHSDDIFVIVPPTNYIDESTIHINITIINTTSPDVNIMVGLSKSENWSTYSTFQEGEPLKNGTDVISRAVTVANKGQSPSWTIVDYIIPVTGYYFVGLSILPQNTQVYFQFDYHIHHYFYSRLDYSIPVCTIKTPDSDTCTLKIMKDIANSEAQTTCVLAYVEDIKNLEQTTHIEVQYTLDRIMWNIYSLIFGSLLLAFFTVAIVVGIVYISFCICKRRQHYYSYEKL